MCVCVCACQIVSGHEWHKWCFKKVQGEQEVKVREVKLQTCPECEEQIEEGQEKTVRVCACVRMHVWI